MTPPNSPETTRVAYTPAEFAALTGMKIKAVRRCITRGEIRATKLGALLHIPASEVDRLFGSTDAA